MRYHLRGRVSDGVLIMWHRKYGEQMWSKCRTRKQFTCSFLNKPFPYGTYAYRPVGNTANRMDRISVDGIAAMENEDA